MNNLIKGMRRIFVSGIFSLCIMAGLATAHPVEAASETYPVYVEGESSYDYANQVLKLLNKVRADAGVDPLVMNEELQEAAMQRAAEIAIDFSHTRPDGNLCFTASDLMYGENIAMGQSSPKAVMTSWTQSQGHYQNMVNEAYGSVGIGVFYASGYYYWVQCFGFTDDAGDGKTGVTTKTYKVNVKGNLTFTVSPSTKTLKKTKTVTPKVTVKNRSYSSFSVQIKAKSLTYSSSNKSIAKVSSKGKITAKKKGTVKITCKLGTKKKTIKIKVK